MRRLLQLVYSVLAACVLWVSFQAVSGYWVQSQVEHKLKFKIRGEHCLDFASPSFRIQNLAMSYQDYFEVLSGDLKIRYNLLPLTPDLLHVWIHGENLKGKLKGKLAAMPDGNKEVTFDRFEVELKLVPRGVLLVAADIHSSVFEFKIQKSNDLKGRILS